MYYVIVMNVFFCILQSKAESCVRPLLYISNLNVHADDGRFEIVDK